MNIDVLYANIDVVVETLSPELSYIFFLSISLIILRQ